MNPEPLTGVYALTLRALNGRERRMLAWLPTEPVRQDFYEKARRNGLEIVKKLKIKREKRKIK